MMPGAFLPLPPQPGRRVSCRRVPAVRCTRREGGRRWKLFLSFFLVCGEKEEEEEEDEEGDFVCVCLRRSEEAVAAASRLQSGAAAVRTCSSSPSSSIDSTQPNFLSSPCFIFFLFLKQKDHN